MTNEQKGFIMTVSMNINGMGNWNHMSWHKFPVEMTIENGNIITNINGTEFTDICPMKGNRRNRSEIAMVVCNHICETWGGTMAEVQEHAQNALAEFNQLLGINA